MKAKPAPPAGTAHPCSGLCAELWKFALFKYSISLEALHLCVLGEAGSSLLMELLRERTVSAGMLGNSTTTGSCNHSPYFREGIIIAQLAVFAVCLIALLLITGFWAWKSKRKPGIRDGLPWWSYGGALLLSTMY
jgi:hypothetical protein